MVVSNTGLMQIRRFAARLLQVSCMRQGGLTWQRVCSRAPGVLRLWRMASMRWQEPPAGDQSRSMQGCERCWYSTCAHRISKETSEGSRNTFCAFHSTQRSTFETICPFLAKALPGSPDHDSLDMQHRGQSHIVPIRTSRIRLRLSTLLPGPQTVGATCGAWRAEQARSRLFKGKKTPGKRAGGRRRAGTRDGPGQGELGGCCP